MGLGSHYESSRVFAFQLKTMENKVNCKIIIKIREVTALT